MDGTPGLPDRLGSRLAEAEGVLAQVRAHAHRLGSIKERARRLQLALTGTEALEDLRLVGALDLNVKTLNALFADAADWVLREFRVLGGRRAALGYVEGLVDRRLLDEGIMKALLDGAFGSPGRPAGSAALQTLRDHVLPSSKVEEVATIRDAVRAILAGKVILLVDGEARGLALGLREWEGRRPQEPEAETVIRGPREGFVETIELNLSLLRRKVRSPYLKLEQVIVGDVTRTELVVAYLQGIAPDALVDEVKRRVSRIRIDGVLESSYVEELIEDAPWSLFPQVKVTERPDVVASDLLEGRVAIVMDGTPFVIVVPTTLWSLLQASEDYYDRFTIASVIRLLRLLFVGIALLLPATYVAITTYHPELLPTPLLLTIAAAREGIPFPAAVEALLLEVTFEILREAAVRLPRPISQAISIVGVLVIGQAAIQAGIVGAPMVIVVALTGLSNFAIPRFNLAVAVRILRFPLLFLAAVLGIYGILLGLLVILVHLVNLRSLGVPYLWPLAPLDPRGLLDVVVRTPLWARNRRPQSTGYPDVRRQDPHLRPGPPAARGGTAP